MCVAVLAKQSAGMNINIKSMTGQTATVQAEQYDYVNTLKNKFYGLTEIPTNEQTLIYAGEVLDGDRTLSSYNIRDGSLLHVVFKHTQSGPILRR